MPEINDALRDDLAAVLPAQFGSGTLEFLSSAETVLATISLPANPFSNPDPGVLVRQGTWEGVGMAAAGTGTQCTHVRFSNGGRTMTLTAGGEGSGAQAIITNDITGLDDDIIVEDNPVSVTSCTITVPGGG